MEVLFIWALLAIGVAVFADSRGRSGFGFFLLSIVLSPLLGLIIVLLTENKTKAAENAEKERLEHERRLAEVKAITAAPVAAAAAMAKGGASVADELKKLAELRDAGVLTEAEFQAQKAATMGISPAPTPAQETPVKSIPMGRCSKCNTAVPLNSSECPNCKAIFAPDSAYRVLPS